MNVEYFEYFRTFFSAIWTFLLSPVPVLNLPWITLFGGGLIMSIVLGSLDHLLGFSVPSIGSVVADALGPNDEITDKRQAKAETKGTKDKVTQNKPGTAYYAHLQTRDIDRLRSSSYYQRGAKK